MMTSATASGPETLYPKHRLRMERAKGLSHLLPALILLSGLSGLLGAAEPLTLLLALEVLVGGAYVLLLVRELRHLRQHGPTHHERVAWLELAAAGILALEGYHIWHRHHEATLRTGQHRFHVLPWLYWAVAVWYVGMAFGMGQLHRRRYLHLHAEGFSGRLHPFGRRFAYHWAEIERLEPLAEDAVMVHLTNGRQRRLSFEKVYEGPQHCAHLLAHHARGPQGNEA